MRKDIGSVSEYVSTKSWGFGLKGVLLTCAAIIGLIMLFSSFYTIDEGQRGVILRNGKVVGVAEPGLGLKIPVIDAISRVSVQSHAVQYQKLEAYSRDQQPATINMSVNFKVPADRVQELYTKYGTIDGLLKRLVERRVQEMSKTVFGQFNAVTSIQERSRLNHEVSAAIKSAISGPVEIEGVQIENIDFSDAYEQSIEQRMLAEVEVQKLRQNAEREKVQAEITVTQAQAKADARRADAQAQADAVRLQAAAEAEAVRVKGEAEATAIKARGDALKDNPGLVALTQAERWNGQLPATMLPNGSIPMLNLKTAE